MSDYATLKQHATTIRLLALEGIHAAKSGHPGGSLSISDIMATLYFKEMSIDPKNPQDPKRDRFVLSKGHAAPAYYAALAQRGYFPTTEMSTLRKLGSNLQGHPCRNKLPGIDMSSGSLGQGLSAANGMAMMAKQDKQDYRVYCICGDGEVQEGQIWEAAMTAAHYKLDNLVVIVDCNGLQLDGTIEDCMDNSPLDLKFQAFGWETMNVDGHNVEELDKAFQKARTTKGKPFAILAKTVKGKGVSFMENNVDWHGAPPNDEQYAKAVAELKEASK
ncbi:MAG: transketolase [Eubacteriales bacterium]